jgi:hypothetical protein
MSPVYDAETDLCKLAAGPAPGVSVTIQLAVCGLFFLAGLIAMINGFAELSHLLQSDSVGMSRRWQLMQAARLDRSTSRGLCGKLLRRDECT